MSLANWSSVESRWSGVLSLATVLLIAFNAGTVPPNTPPKIAARPACSNRSRNGVSWSVAASVTNPLMNSSRASSDPSSNAFFPISFAKLAPLNFFSVSFIVDATTLVNTSSLISSTLAKRVMMFLIWRFVAPPNRASSRLPRPKAPKVDVIAAVMAPLVRPAPNARSCICSGVSLPSCWSCE